MQTFDNGRLLFLIAVYALSLTVSQWSFNVIYYIHGVMNYILNKEKVNEGKEQ